MKTPRATCSTAWLALGILAVLLIGCGGGGDKSSTWEGPKPWEVRTVQMPLNGTQGPEHAGILMADEKGYFEDAKLEVLPGSPAIPSAPIGYALGEENGLGVTHLPQVAIAVANGTSVVAVGSLVSQPTASMIWLKRSGIEGIADLKGKKIGLPGIPFQKLFLQQILRRAGLSFGDVRLKFVSYDAVTELAGGRVDAVFGVSSNVDGAELQARGLDPVITPVQELGIPSYNELVVVAPRASLAKEPQLIREFLAALYRGTASAVGNQPRTLQVLEDTPDRNPDLSSAGMKAGIEATLPLLSGSGYIDPPRAKALVSWMYREGMLRRKPRIDALLTNRYLPQS